MIDTAWLRSHSRPMVALGLDLRSPRMELAHITHHPEAKRSSSLVSKTQTPSSAEQICSPQRSPAWRARRFPREPGTRHAPAPGTTDPSQH